MFIGDVPPQIRSLPSGAVLGLGAGHELSAGALGPGSVGRQWFFNGVEVPGATSSNLMLMNAQFTDAGSYQLAVSNAFGGTNFTVLVGVYELAQDPDGRAKWTVAGPAGAAYRIEYRTNLAEAWQTLTNLVVPGTPKVWMDNASYGKEQRYYRAIRVP